MDPIVITHGPSDKDGLSVCVAFRLYPVFLNGFTTNGWIGLGAVLMSQYTGIVLAGVIVLGVAAQWLAWRLGLPSILLLLLTGVVAGPLSGLVDPDAIFGSSLLPLVSLSVALILYEGGLSLRLSELSKVGAAVRNLLSVGVLVTWLIAGWAAWAILGFDGPVAVLFGAILVVTGPTVIGPLLQQIRPTGPAASILKWEGIAIDPLGAVLAVVVFDLISVGHEGNPWIHGGLAVLRTVGIGGGLGFFVAGLYILLIKRFWVPDHLQNGVSLMLAVTVFAVSNYFQEESGLLGVTVMGVTLANQKWVTVEHIVQFKEDLRVLLIGTLFILLAARLRLEDLSQLGMAHIVFVLVLIVVARPLSVWISTIGMGLSGAQRVFLSWMAPRGDRGRGSFICVGVASPGNRISRCRRVGPHDLYRGRGDRGGVRFDGIRGGTKTGRGAAEATGFVDRGGGSMGSDRGRAVGGASVSRFVGRYKPPSHCRCSDAGFGGLSRQCLVRPLLRSCGSWWHWSTVGGDAE